MPRAHLTLTIPDGVWIGDLSRSHPETRFRILAALPNESRGVGLIEIASSTLPEPLSALREVAEVTAVDLLEATDDTALVQLETSMPFLLLPVKDSGVPLEMPFDIQDGEANWEVTAPQERLSALGDQLDAFGIQFTVDRIHQRIDTEQLLTNRQLRLVKAAVEHGYYDTPRGCSLTELADRVGIAKSTCSETLHRAEEQIIKQFVGEPTEEETLMAGPE